MNRRLLADIIRQFLIYFILCLVTYLMLRVIIGYTAFRDDVAFLQFKQDYVTIPLWKTCFYIHVFSSIAALLAGFTQFSDHILRNHRVLHRRMGRIYAWDILLINFPTGMVMAFYANGGIVGKTAFVILDSLWFWFTLQGVLAAKKGDIKRHRKMMIRSYALTFSAITLRLWKGILSNSFEIEPATLYIIDAWLGFVPNLLFAEWIICKRFAGKRRNQRDIPTL